MDINPVPETVLHRVYVVTNTAFIIKCELGELTDLTALPAKGVV
jgi:hypothetical protein